MFDTDSIYNAARELLGRFPMGGRGVRLTGVTVSDLSPGPPPRTLFVDPVQQKRQRIEELANSIRDRFGGNSLTRATLLGETDPHISK